MNPAASAAGSSPLSSSVQELRTAVDSNPYQQLSVASAQEIGTVLSQFSDQPQAIVAAWELDGKGIIASTPSKIRAALAKAFPSQAHAFLVSSFKTIQEFIVNAHAVSPDSFDADTFTPWPSAHYSASLPLPHGGGAVFPTQPLLSHGGGARASHQPFLSHGGGGDNQLIPPPGSGSRSAWQTPISAKDNPMKFAFGKAVTPIPLFGRALITPSFDPGVTTFHSVVGAVGLGV
jgi:hypothetical protein